VAERAVADTGPLVAIVCTREKAHKKCAAALKTLRAASYLLAGFD